MSNIPFSHISWNRRSYIFHRQLIRLTKTPPPPRLSYFEIFSVKFTPVERVIVFWINKRSNPTPNSIAEKMRKKKVNEIIFTSLTTYPIRRARAYNVTHSISAVNKRWRKETTLTEMLKKSSKNSSRKVFASPNIKKILINFLSLRLNKL